MARRHVPPHEISKKLSDSYVIWHFFQALPRLSGNARGLVSCTQHIFLQEHLLGNPPEIYSHCSITGLVTYILVRRGAR